MANRRGKYLLTQRRKAALHKAQLASARKRRGRRRVVAGIAGGAGILAVVGGVGFVGHRYVTKVGKGGPQQPVIVPASNTVTPHRPPLPGKKLKISSRYRDPNTRKPTPMHKLKKRAAKREVARIRKNDKRRMDYWSGRSANAARGRPNHNGPGLPHTPKKVGGSPRKNARASAKERMAEKERRRTINKMVQKDKRLEKQSRVNNVSSLDSHRKRKKS